MNPELTEPLRRQRRLLVLTSLALIAWYLLYLRPKSDVEMSGLALEIHRPKDVIIALWTVWGWALWRYGQRFYELASVLWNEVRDDVDAEDLRIALSKAKKVGNKLATHKELGSPEQEQVEFTESFAQNSVPGPKSRAPTSARIRGAISRLPDGPGGVTPTSDGGRRYSLIAMFDWNDGTANSGQEGFVMMLTRRQVRSIRIRAWAHALFRLPAFSEHIAPLIIAVGAPAAWLSSLC